jgi:hypothetical protein
VSRERAHPQHVLTDLFDSGDFPAEIIDPEHAAEIVIQRLIGAGFKIDAAERYLTKAPAPIDKEAESATIGRSRKATEALTAQRRPSGI